MADPFAAVPPAGAAQPAHESPVICAERRIASHTHLQNLSCIILGKGDANWQQAACGDSVEQHASTPATSQLVKDVLCRRPAIGPQKLTTFTRAFTVDPNNSAEAKWTSDGTWKVLQPADQDGHAGADMEQQTVSLLRGLERRSLQALRATPY